MSQTLCNWDDYSPKYVKPTVHIKQLCADVSIGTFLLVRPTDDSQVFVGRMIDSTIHNDNQQESTTQLIKLNHFKTLSSYSNLPILPIASGVGADVCEIVQTHEIEEHDLNAFHMVEVAFVFPLESIEKGVAANCAGMDNVFLCRFRHFNGFVEPSTYAPFPSLGTQIDTCYASRIWDSLVLLKDTILNGLHRCSEQQGEISRFSSKIPFSKESWAYLCRRTKEAGPPRQCATRQIRRRLTKGFQSDSLRIQQTSQLLRFEREDQLKIFRSTLGAMSTYGIRKRWARIGASKCLHENDTLNVVVGSNHVEQPFSIRTRQSGVDLMFDSVMLKVSIRYTKYLYATTANGNATHCPSAHLEQMLGHCRKHRVPENRNVLSIGSIFQNDGLVLEISQVTEDEVTCQILAPRDQRGKVVSFQDKGFVEQRMLKCLS